VINTIPSGRNYSSLGQLIPGVFTTAPDQGGALGDPMPSLTIHGSRTIDQRVMQNGVNTMTLQAGGNIGIAVPNPGMAAEVTIDTSAVSTEQAVGGIRINYIARDGGHTFAGNLFVTFANEDMQGDNLTQRLRDKGLTLANSIRIRLTAQATPKNKVAFTWDQQFRCRCPGGPGTQGVIATRSPEAAGFFRSPVQRLLHAEWTSPVTNRLLLEGVALHRTERWGFNHPDAAYRSSFLTEEQTELLTQMIPVRELSTGLQYRSRQNYAGHDRWTVGRRAGEVRAGT
jgi:hypothetical protein